MRGKKLSIWGAVAVVVLLVTAVLYLYQQGPDVSQYEFLKEPRITRMQDQRMVEVIARGDPNVVGGEAFKILFKTYYKLPSEPKGGRKTPRARWAGDMNVKSSWTGYYGLPISSGVTALPQIDAEPGYEVRLITWEYGDVAEILHVGSYASETPTILKLHQFIEKQGYEIVGLHEEEYVKGPGMLFKGNPDQYITIIRNRIQKKT